MFGKIEFFKRELTKVIKYHPRLGKVDSKVLLIIKSNQRGQRNDN